EKGSIAVEGVSLTIQKIKPTSFSIDVIPYTFAHTNLKYKKVGDWVNLEFDYLLKSSINKEYFGA
ncbi:MAG: riboflavin synthase, partial [Candidatus Omnitrophica bacterium]|nr:riboflavin synthase [Candidatus Omnitrophota bacterium]